jgi:hypothetical protein
VAPIADQVAEPMKALRDGLKERLRDCPAIR